MTITLQETDYQEQLTNNASVAPQLQNMSDAIYKLDDIYSVKELFTSIDELLFQQVKNDDERAELASQIGDDLIKKGFLIFNEYARICGIVNGLDNSDFDATGLILKDHALYISVAF